MKKLVLILLLAALAAGIKAEGKIRLSLAGGYSVLNDLAGSNTFSLSPKLALAYPITPKEKAVNVELGVVGLYEAQLTGRDLRAPGFGFGIRVFYNDWAFVRPYFNHEILTRIILTNGMSGSADSFSVLLGLGADFPLAPDRTRESDSVFMDLSYVFYNTAYFGVPAEKVKTFFLTAGYEVPY